MDGSHWLSNMTGYPVKDAMKVISKVIGESVGGGGGSMPSLTVHYDRVLYLPWPTYNSGELPRMVKLR